MLTNALLENAERVIREFMKTQDYHELLLAGATQLVGENLTKAIEDGADAVEWLEELAVAGADDDATALIAAKFLNAVYAERLLIDSGDAKMKTEIELLAAAIAAGTDPVTHLRERADADDDHAIFTLSLIYA